VTALAIRAPQVVAEEVDGEVIAINLDTGAYYSFRGVASVIWQHLLASPRTDEALVAELREMYPNAGDLEPGVAAFMTALRGEELVADVVDGTATPTRSPVVRGAPASFSVPVYEKYTDMEAFLLVDPIHDFDVSEWPAVKPAEPATE
jgi:hypothetical protein